MEKSDLEIMIQETWHKQRDLMAAFNRLNRNMQDLLDVFVTLENAVREVPKFDIDEEEVNEAF